MDIPDEEWTTRLAHFKQARSTAKGWMTRKGNEICELVASDLCEEKLSDVCHLAEQLVDYMRGFRQHHMSYHGMLTDESELSSSELYCEEVETRYREVLRRVDEFKIAVKQKMAGTQAASEIQCGDSASNVSNKSDTSSVKSARLKIAAKRAALCHVWST